MKTFIKNILPKNRFVQNVGVLVSGTAIGQLIAILTLPVLSRIYDPDAFSVLAVYLSVLTVLTSVSGMCFEYAIPLPKLDRIAASLLLLAVTSVLIFTGLTTLAVVFMPNVFNSLTNYKITQYLWLLPIGVFSVGMYNSLQYWSTRNKKFGLIAKTRVTQSLSGTGVKLGSGYLLNGGVLGLIFGQVIAQGAGFLSLGMSLLKNDFKIFSGIKPKYIYLTLKRYDQFPKFTSLEVFANNASIQIPIIIIAYYAVDTEAGHMMIAMQLLSAPIGMISSAVSQVYLAEASDRLHNGSFKKFTKETIKKLLKISFIPLLIIGMVAPIFIPYLLGDVWSRTGTLISWMIPWFLMQFITSPVSTCLYITNNQKLAFFLQFIGLFIRVGLVYIAALFFNERIGEFYAVSGFIFYSIYLVVVLKVVSKIQDKPSPNIKDV